MEEFEEAVQKRLGALDPKPLENLSSATSSLKTPDPTKLLGWMAVFRLRWKKNLISQTQCAYPDCGLVLRQNFNLPEHLNKHCRHPGSECALCGARTRHGIDVHFRREHPEEPRILALDIRYLIEEELLAVFFRSFPDLGDIGPFYAALGAQQPKRWIAAVQNAFRMGFIYQPAAHC